MSRRRRIRASTGTLCVMLAIGFGLLNALIPCAVLSGVGCGYLVGAFHD